MKYRFLIIGLLSLAGISCSVKDITAPEDADTSSQEDEVFYATIENQPYEAETKTFTDETLRVFWNKDDHVTIFNNVTGGLEYTFKGDDGDAGGTFKKTNSSDTAGGESLGGKKYAIYPYREDTRIDPDGIISFTLPASQTYSERSFGRGANTMVAMTEDDAFRFKNVGGYLVFKLYGKDVSVSSIILKNENGAPLAGPCRIDMSAGIPAITMDQAGSTAEVRLEFVEPVKLGATAADYTEFWFVLPPVDFTQAEGGFTLSVATPNGGLFVKKAKIDLSIQRNRVRKTAPVEVKPSTVTGGMMINSLSPNAKTLSSGASEISHKTEYDSSTLTFTMTMPTVTDFSRLVLDFDIGKSDMLLADGKEIQSGVTPVDARNPVSLIVRRGLRERRYTLVARNTGLPVVRITTQGFTQEDLDNDENHETWRPIENVAGEKASVRIENPDGSLSCEVATQVRGRGNSTWMFPKKPYALKFNKKKSVLGMPEHKRWVLLANWIDRSLLRNDAAYWLSRQSGLPYTVRGQFVELEFNGVHRGNYYLCEQIKINPNRVAITEMKSGETGASDPEKLTGGYLMEIDSFFDEVNKFRSSVFGLKYTFKDPDEDALSPEAFAYMQNYVNTMEGYIMNAETGEYRDYLDMDSAIWFLLVNELAGNSDFFNSANSENAYGPHSTYLYKDKGGKLFMGPVWDFDYGSFTSTGWIGATREDYYFSHLYKDPVFRERMLELWADFSEASLGLTDYVDEMADKIRLSEEFNSEIWKNQSSYQSINSDQRLSFQESVDRLKSGFLNRWSFINRNIGWLQ